MNNQLFYYDNKFITIFIKEKYVIMNKKCHSKTNSLHQIDKTIGSYNLFEVGANIINS